MCIRDRYGEVWHNINANDSMHQINEMDDKIYDFIRDDVEFKKIAEELALNSMVLSTYTS